MRSKKVRQKVTGNKNLTKQFIMKDLCEKLRAAMNDDPNYNLNYSASTTDGEAILIFDYQDRTLFMNLALMGAGLT